MAATLTDSGELTYASFAIEKTETDADGDLIVYGKCSDGGLDHDEQVVSPAWMAEASKRWLATGANLRVNHNPQRDPAGIGLEVNTDAEGATWLKGVIVEPVAQKLVSKGALRAFSVGIARPTIERDVTGKARGGVIKGGELIEVSLVDRPANARCRFELVKSVDGGAAYSGELIGEQADIAKALNEASTTKSAGPAVQDAVNNIDTFESPADISFDFTPNDLMDVLQRKMVARANGELEVFKEAADDEEATLKAAGIDVAKDHREFNADRRRSLASSGHALPDGSYPIPDKDALRRAAILARSGHGNVAAARRLIARRAKELGVPNPLDADDKAKKQLEELEATYKELGLLGEDEHLDIAALKNAAEAPTADDAHADTDTDHDFWSRGGKQKKPLPGKPMKKSANDDDPDAPNDEDDDVSAKEDTPDVTKEPPKGKKPKKGKKLPPWLQPDEAKCHTDPKTASGAEEPADMQPAPVGELQESPAKPHMKAYADAMLRFKTVGIDAELGKLHDFTCPAYDPSEVAKLYAGDEVATLVDERVWQVKALSAAAGKSISEAMEAQHAWHAAATLKAADASELWAYRQAAHKAFRDANPGPTSAPTPCEMTPGKYNRPLITDGHETSSPGHDGPTTSSSVASGTPNAHHFDRPPLSGGHQSPSPSFMKGGFEYPEQQGVPTSINYGMMEKEKDRQALSALHDSISRMFPGTCPMGENHVQQPAARPVPTPVGIGKGDEEPGELADITKYIRKLEKKVAAGELTGAEAREKLSRRTAEKYARDLAKQVEKGITSREAVLKALGIEPPKAEAPAEPSVAKQVQASTDYIQQNYGGQQAPQGMTPDLLKSAMAEMLAPVQEKLDAQTSLITQQEALLGEYKAKMEAQDAELSKHRERWDALAAQPDPSTAAFTGLALAPAAKGANPAGVAKQADAADRAQSLLMRQLERTWRTGENPAEREAAWAALQRYKGSDL